MYFTQNDFLKIYEWIKRHSIRDSEFEESTIIEDDDTVTVVTSKGNRKIKIKALIEVFIDKITGGDSSLVTKEELDRRQYITSEYVDTIINDLIGAAPETLNTLEELAEALKDNDDIIDTLEKAISNKADRSELPSLEGYATEEFVENKGYLTEHQDISSKQDNLVSGTNIKTINNQSILGEGNINIEAGMDEETLSEFSTLKNKMDILYKVSLALYGGKNVEVGTTQTVNLSWTIKVNGSDVNPGSQTISNGTTTETLGATVRNKTYTGVKTNTTYTLTVDGVTATANVKFYYPAYFGVVSSDYQVSGSTAGLTKLSNYGSRTYNGVTSTEGYNKVVYMYPSSLGALTSIKDANNFELLGSFTSSTISIGGVSYYAYVITNATNTASQTFKFS